MQDAYSVPIESSLSHARIRIIELIQRINDGRIEGLPVCREIQNKCRHLRQSVVATPYTDKLIKSKARKLCRRTGCSRSDKEDIIQELKCRLLEKATLYDPARGAKPETFADRVITSDAKMIQRCRKALKRAAGYRAIPLDAAPAQADRSHNDCGDDETQISIERAELHLLVATSPPRARAIMRGILDGMNVTDIARELGYSRQAIYRILHAQRDRFTQAGFAPRSASHPRSIRRRSA